MSLSGRGPGPLADSLPEVVFLLSATSGQAPLLPVALAGLCRASAWSPTTPEIVTSQIPESLDPHSHDHQLHPASGPSIVHPTMTQSPAMFHWQAEPGLPILLT